jgi:hypothetical protein
MPSSLTVYYLLECSNKLDENFSTIIVKFSKSNKIISDCFFSVLNLNNIMFNEDSGAQLHSIEMGRSLAASVQSGFYNLKLSSNFITDS